jgi:hypothetical protein
VDEKQMVALGHFENCQFVLSQPTEGDFRRLGISRHQQWMSLLDSVRVEAHFAVWIFMVSEVKSVDHLLNLGPHLVVRFWQR